jgi:hypothetical protein
VESRRRAPAADVHYAPLLPAVKRHNYNNR